MCFYFCGELHISPLGFYDASHFLGNYIDPNLLGMLTGLFPDDTVHLSHIHPIRYHIKRRQVTISEKVACRPIYELCAEAEQMPGTIRMMGWWDHDVVNELDD